MILAQAGVSAYMGAVQNMKIMSQPISKKPFKKGDAPRGLAVIEGQKPEAIILQGKKYYI